VCVGGAVARLGNRDGGTVVQVYAIDATQPGDRQVAYLLGFQRVHAQPGSTATATVECDLTPISRRDPGTRTWSIADGQWRLTAAQHSHDPDATAPADLLESGELGLESLGHGTAAAEASGNSGEHRHHEHGC